MVGNGIGDPRMGQLQEERATGAEKKRGFAYHAPGQRCRTKQPGQRLTGALKLFDLAFEVVTGDEYWLLRGNERLHFFINSTNIALGVKSRAAPPTGHP